MAAGAIGPLGDLVTVLNELRRHGAQTVTVTGKGSDFDYTATFGPAAAPVEVYPEAVPLDPQTAADIEKSKRDALVEWSS